MPFAKFRDFSSIPAFFIPGAVKGVGKYANYSVWEVLVTNRNESRNEILVANHIWSEIKTLGRRFRFLTSILIVGELLLKFTTYSLRLWVTYLFHVGRCVWFFAVVNQWPTVTRRDIACPEKAKFDSPNIYPTTILDDIQNSTLTRYYILWEQNFFVQQKANFFFAR